MNRAGSGEQNSNARLVERNLRQRAIFLSLFAVLLLFINALPFFQPVDSKSLAVVTLRPAGKDASWQLMLTPDKAASTAEGGAFSLAGNTAPGTVFTDDCSVPPEFAPFFALAMDINRAQAKDLTLLPGIGPTLGHRIVAEREKNGPYENPQALQRVTGIGPQTFAGLAPHICAR